MKQKKSSKMNSLKGLAIIPFASAIMIATAQNNTVVVPVQTTANLPKSYPTLAQNNKKTSTTNSKQKNSAQATVAKSTKAENQQNEVVVTGYANSEKSKEQKKDLDEVLNAADELPKFADGSVSEYFAKNIKYPVDAQKRGAQGRVICQYIVEKDGSISSVRVVRGVDPLLDAEACRLIYSMPKWIPGKQNGQIVRVRYTIPVNFRLN